MTDIGDAIRFGNPAIDPVTGQAIASPVAAFKTGGAAIDPTAVTLTIQRPDGTQLVYGWPAPGADGPLIRESAGRFYADVVIDQSDRWRCFMRGTGNVAAAAETSLYVQRTKVTA